MTQQDILKLLKKNKGKWFTVTEILRIMPKTRSSMSKALLKLRQYHLVILKEYLIKREICIITGIKNDIFRTIINIFHNNYEYKHSHHFNLI